jgi:hypothetical protein
MKPPGRKADQIEKGAGRENYEGKRCHSASFKAQGHGELLRAVSSSWVQSLVVASSGFYLQEVPGIRPAAPGDVALDRRPAARTTAIGASETFNADRANDRLGVQERPFHGA